MKTTITTFILFFAVALNAQFDDRMIGIEKIGERYIVTDTTLQGADTLITKRIISDSTFNSQYMASVAATFMEVATAKGKAIVSYEKALRQRDELQKLNLLGTYLNYVDEQMTISGQFRASYGATSTTLVAQEDEHLYTLGGRKVVNVVEVARNWVRCTMLTMQNEVIDLYEIRPGVWAGEGVNGLLSIQKL